MPRNTPALFKSFPVVLVTILCSSSLLSAQVRDRTPPTTPGNLRVTDITEESVSLAWDPSTDNSGKFSYYISGVGPQIVVSQTLTSHTVTGLWPRSRARSVTDTLAGVGTRWRFAASSRGTRSWSLSRSTIMPTSFFML